MPHSWIGYSFKEVFSRLLSRISRSVLLDHHSNWLVLLWTFFLAAIQNKRGVWKYTEYCIFKLLKVLLLRKCSWTGSFNKRATKQWGPERQYIIVLLSENSEIMTRNGLFPKWHPPVVLHPAYSCLYMSCLHHHSHHVWGLHYITWFSNLFFFKRV